MGQQVLVATDMAARGLDLPAIDLVLHFGMPLYRGKDGTFDPELYVHRTGRAGRVGGGFGLGYGYDSDSSRPTSDEMFRDADSVILYDPTAGEEPLLQGLKENL